MDTYGTTPFTAAELDYRIGRVATGLGPARRRRRARRTEADLDRALRRAGRGGPGPDRSR